MEVFFGGALSWVATVIGSVAAVLLTLAAYRFFRDTKSRLVAPITWMLGYFLGSFVMVSSLSWLANWRHDHAILTIIETSWLQKVIVLLAPGIGILVGRALGHTTAP